MLSGQPPPNDVERDLLALPARLGGIAVSNPSNAADSKSILKQEFYYTSEILTKQINARSEVRKLR